METSAEGLGFGLGERGGGFVENKINDTFKRIGNMCKVYFIIIFCLFFAWIPVPPRICGRKVVNAGS